MRVLVLKRDKLGDMLLTTPMLAILRGALPQATIDVLASDYNAWVLDGNADVNRVWSYRRSRVAGRASLSGALSQLVVGAQLRWQRYDVAIAAQGEASPRATRRARFVGAARTIAYVDGDEARISDPLVPPTQGHERDRVIALLAPLGIAAPRQLPLPRFRPSQEMLAQADAWLLAEGLQSRGYAVIGLGTRRAKKQPDRRQVREWSEWLRRAHGLETVFMWTPGGSDNASYPGDDATAQRVLEERPSFIHPFRGPLAPAIGLVWNARVSIFPDSGLMHFAAASPGGVLGLFAESRVSPPPSQWAPLGPKAQILDAPRSVGDLDDALVFEQLEALLDSRRAP